MTGRIQIIGVGNAARGDDGIGRAVARSLAERLGSGAGIMESNGEAAALIAAFEGHDAVVLVDASKGGGPPGALRRWDVPEILQADVPADPSSHGLGVGHAIKLAAVLGRLPPLVVIYTVEGEDFTLGAGLSQPVADSIAPATEVIAGEVMRLAKGWRGEARLA